MAQNIKIKGAYLFNFSMIFMNIFSKYLSIFLKKQICFAFILTILVVNKAISQQSELLSPPKIDPARYKTLFTINIGVGTAKADNRYFNALMRNEGLKYEKSLNAPFEICASIINKKYIFDGHFQYIAGSKTDKIALNHKNYAFGIGRTIIRQNNIILGVLGYLGKDNSATKFDKTILPSFLAGRNLPQDISELKQDQWNTGLGVDINRFWELKNSGRGVSLGLKATYFTNIGKAKWKYGYTYEDGDQTGYEGDVIDGLPNAFKNTFSITAKIGYWLNY